MKAKSTRDEPLKIPLKFDDAIKRAVTVKPPPEGWPKHMKKLRRELKRRRQKSTV